MMDYVFDYSKLAMSDILKVLDAEMVNTAQGVAAGLRLMEKAGLDLDKVPISEAMDAHEQFWKGIRFHWNPTKFILGDE